jgi:uncharacterized protein (DUF849 family)
MTKPVLITCAPAGGIHSPTVSEYLSITPIEIATAPFRQPQAHVLHRQKAV